MSEKTRAVWAPNARAASSASQASTTTSGSASGEARFELFAGDQGAHFSVEVEAEPAPRLRFDIVVQRDDAGEVTIRVHYDPDEGRYTFAELHAAQVHLYDGRGNCDVLRRAAPDLHNAALWAPYRYTWTVEGLARGSWTFTFSAAAAQGAALQVFGRCVRQVQ